MTKRNTYIITAIVVAAVVAGVVVYANWDSLRTAIGLGNEAVNTHWIELNGGTTAGTGGGRYTVSQSPDSLPSSENKMPSDAPFSGKLSRWDWERTTPDTGPVVMQLGNNIPDGTYNLAMVLDYQSAEIPQGEPLQIDSYAADQTTKLGTVTIRDTSYQSDCMVDNTEVRWRVVDRDCSSGNYDYTPGNSEHDSGLGWNKLSLRMQPGGRLVFTSTGGSLDIGGVRIFGTSTPPPPTSNVDIPKTPPTQTIKPTEDMKFTFTIKNTSNAVAHDVILYESFNDQGLDGQVDMDRSSIGGQAFFGIPKGCSDATPEGGYCFLDMGGKPGTVDTIIGYKPTLEANASIPVELVLKPQQTGFVPNADPTKPYINRVGITSKEMNPGNTYPPQTAEQLATGIANWNWVHRDAAATVTGAATGLVLEKSVDSPTVAPGGTSVFTVNGGNTSTTTHTKVIYWDTWGDDKFDGTGTANHNFDQQVDSVEIDVVGDSVGYVPLTLPEGQYMDCQGTEKLAACYVDIDGDDFGDTILVWTAEMKPTTLQKFFDLKFKFKSGAVANTYRNTTSITSCEYNLDLCRQGESVYPGQFGVTAFTWASTKYADVTVGSGPQPLPTPGTPDATLDKSVSPADGGAIFDPTKAVGYKFVVKNTGGRDLTNVQLIDDYDETRITPDSPTTPGDYTIAGGKLTFKSFDLPLTNQGVTLTYKASITAGTAGQAVNNTAQCQEVSTSGVTKLPSCNDTAQFTVGAGPILPVSGPHAVLSKTVANAGVTQPGPESTTLTVNPGDKVEYTLKLTNDGDKTLTNMKVTDVFAATYLENVTITQGTSCTSPGQPPEVSGQVCFQIEGGTLPSGTSAPTMKYTATVKSSVANGTEVNNNANCKSDEFPTSASDLCHASVMFKVGTGGPSPVGNYELWVTKVVNRATAKRGEKLDYTTTGGNKRSGEASSVWLIDSLLFAQNGEVQLPQLQEAAGKLSSTATVEEVQTTLQQSLSIVSTGGVSQPGTTVQSTRVVQANGDVIYYKNLPGDDATTGLQIKVSDLPAGSVLDLDRDGIKDTVIHQKNQTWPGSTSALQTKYIVNPYTSVRADLTAGEYRIVNTGVVFKLDTKEVYNARAVTTVNISGPVEAAPAIAVTKTVSDTDETNKTSNTATAGEVMTYTVNYTNNTGSGTAHGAYIEDDYDERYIKITDNGGSTDSGSALLWTLGDVAAGQTVTKTFKVTINSDLAESGATFKNIGTVGAQNQAEKSAEVTTTVPTKTNPSDQPYLVTSKTVVNENGGVIQPGDTLRYTVTIENKGKAAATNVSMEDTLPTALEGLKIVTIPTGAKDESTGNKIKITGFTVNAGASVQIVYTATVKAGTANGTKISNGEVVTYGTTGGRSTGTATGQVGSAFTGPGTGYAEANALEAGAAKAATTGASPLTVALVVTGLAGAAGVTTLVLRRRMLVS